MQITSESLTGAKLVGDRHPEAGGSWKNKSEGRLPKGHECCRRSTTLEGDQEDTEVMKATADQQRLPKVTTMTRRSAPKVANVSEAGGYLLRATFNTKGLPEGDPKLRGGVKITFQ